MVHNDLTLCNTSVCDAQVTNQEIPGKDYITLALIILATDVRHALY